MNQIPMKIEPMTRRIGLLLEWTVDVTASQMKNTDRGTPAYV
jgi:hypothetical protein